MFFIRLVWFSHKGAVMLDKTEQMWFEKEEVPGVHLPIAGVNTG